MPQKSKANWTKGDWENFKELRKKATKALATSYKNCVLIY